jgi:Bifunctional DNA primase/polymerase, N-terminal
MPTAADGAAAMADLYVPELDADDDTIAAALRYAAAGWYVLPIRRNARKHPGSVVGKLWQDQSSRDPEVIAAWFAGTDHGIALHVGRSGGLALDVDYPDRVPDVLATAIRDHAPPHQSTRTNVPGRGHYLFAMPEGRTLGNGTGRLGGTWGQIRGLNGVVIVEPSLHDNADEGGRYAWDSVGSVPVLPDPVAVLLDDASPAEDAATDAQVAAFLLEHTGNARPELLPGWVTTFTRKVAAGESRHDRMVSVCAGAMKEARAGLIPARLVADTLHSVFVEAVGKPPTSKGQGPARHGAKARSEYAGILAWAVAQANAANLDDVRSRVGEKVPSGPTVVVDDTGKVYEWFWNARPILRHVHDFARARRCSPWAVLGVTLARVCTAVPPFVVLPPLVGGHVSLNTYVGLVGPSGAGKDAAGAAAGDAVELGHVEMAGVGSGEGIAHQFMTYKRPIKTDAGGLMQYREAVLLTAAEVDTLAALHRRQASTLLPELRKAWTGAALGFAYVDKEKRLTLPEHHYRLCLLVGIQPERAAAILDDVDAGTPQRWLWLPATDPDAPDEPPPEPGPWTDWRLPRWPMATTAGRVVLQVCPTARDVIDAARLARLRGDGAALDGHALLCRLKVAAVLAILDGRAEVDDQDWNLAGVIAAESEWTRQGVVATLQRIQRDANAARGKAEGERLVVATEVVDHAATKRVARLVKQKITSEWLAHNDLRKKITSRDRGYFDAAVDHLVAAGQIECEDTDNLGPAGIRYRLIEEAT